MRYRVRQEIEPHPVTGARQWDSWTFKTDAAAKAKRRELLISPATRASRTKLADYLRDDWWPEYARMVSPSTLRQRRVIIDRWIIPYLGAVKLGELSTAKIERQVRRMQDAGCSASRVKNVVTVLSVALNAAVRAGALSTNPSTHVRLPRRNPAERRTVWTQEQANWFLEQQEGLWGILWTTIIGTGMRVAEARALHWRDVDLPNRIITVRYTWARGDDGEYLSAPKTKSGNREVLIPPELVEPLQHWHGEQRKHAWANGLVVDEDTLVFCRDDLSPLPASTVDGRWEREIEKYGMPTTTIHGLRHLAVTQQINDGVPLKIVSQRIGHSNISLTADLYGHVLREHQEQAAASLGRLIRRQRVPDVTPIKRKSQKTQ